ncbi:hypothetical protein J6590_000914 [Homalodisca vitripennis]|nr:hypothetical protein J6590_000914 [Homalodisca vitripennis]
MTIRLNVPIAQSPVDDDVRRCSGVVSTGVTQYPTYCIIVKVTPNRSHLTLLLLHRWNGRGSAVSSSTIQGHPGTRYVRSIHLTAHLDEYTIDRLLPRYLVCTFALQIENIAFTRIGNTVLATYECHVLRDTTPVSSVCHPGRPCPLC